MILVERVPSTVPLSSREGIVTLAKNSGFSEGSSTTLELKFNRIKNQLDFRLSAFATAP